MQEGGAFTRGTTLGGTSRSVTEAIDFEALSEHLAERLIFVVGNARGGSTFTNSAIGIHPRILCVGWNNILFGPLLPQLQRLDPAELRRKILRPETGKHYDERLALQHIGAANLAGWNAYVDKVCRDRDLRRLVCLQGLLYWVMHRPTIDLRDCAAWCIKDNSWAGIRLLKRLMPKTRVVIVQRDPRSTALSFAKVYARARKEHFNNRDIARGALDWLRNAVEFAVWLERDSDALLLYFEELVVDPPATLNRVWTDLGLNQLDPQMMQAALAQIEYTTTKTHEERGRGPNASGLHTAPLTRWHEQLSAEQVAHICALTRAAANYFGYTFDSDPKVHDILIALRHAGTADLAKTLTLFLHCRMRLHLMTRSRKTFTSRSWALHYLMPRRGARHPDKSQPGL